MLCRYGLGLLYSGVLNGSDALSVTKRIETDALEVSKRIETDALSVRFGLALLWCV